VTTTKCSGTALGPEDATFTLTTVFVYAVTTSPTASLISFNSTVLNISSDSVVSMVTVALTSIPVEG
jgi:hypothetical protein